MQASPLAELKDIHLPEPTSLWPPAAGWWIVLALLVSFIILLVVWQIKRWRLTKAKRKALTELAGLTSTTDEWPQKLHILLRRLTVSYYAQDQVAQLYGQSWEHFLVSQLKPTKQEKYKDVLKQLIDAQYQSKAELDFTQTSEAIKFWITNALPPKQNTPPNKSLNNISEAKENV